jgi:uncharacterized membrane protein
MYLSNKYALLRYVKMPDMFSTMMATFFANFMPFVVLTWAIAYIVFISKINGAYSESFSEDIKAQELKLEAYDQIDSLQSELTNTDVEKLSDDDKSHMIALVSLLFTIICIILPIRLIVIYCCDSGEVSPGEEYKDRCMYFATDYDKENPLTCNQGKLRLIESQLQHAKAKGNTDAVAALEA